MRNKYYCQLLLNKHTEDSAMYSERHQIHDHCPQRACKPAIWDSIPVLPLTHSFTRHSTKSENPALPASGCGGEQGSAITELTVKELQHPIISSFIGQQRHLLRTPGTRHWRDATDATSHRGVAVFREPGAEQESQALKGARHLTV